MSLGIDCNIITINAQGRTGCLVPGSGPLRMSLALSEDTVGGKLGLGELRMTCVVLLQYMRFSGLWCEGK